MKLFGNIILSVLAPINDKSQFGSFFNSKSDAGAVGRCDIFLSALLKGYETRNSYEMVSRHVVICLIILGAHTNILYKGLYLGCVVRL